MPKKEQAASIKNNSKKRSSADKPPASTTEFPIVAMGASAGGLEAFETFFKHMPNNSGMAFILIAHLDPSHISLLPQLIQKHSKMDVHPIEDGLKVEPNNIYVIPPNKNIAILNGNLQLLDISMPRGYNLPIDAFFRSLSKDQGRNAICVILSGSGSDGAQGLRDIKGDGGLVIAQDEKSAKYDGMPRSAAATGLVDFILPPEEIPEQLMSYTKLALRQAQTTSRSEFSTSNFLQKIYLLLQAQTGHDFSHYKKNTICRRIERRMNIHQIADIKDYARYLQESEREVAILYKELLIGVTNFFRDSEAFDILRDEYLPKLLAEKPDGYTIRVWVAGCSTGEEAYSLAIILHECMSQLKRHFNVQVFGTDLDEEAIAQARSGLYPNSIAADVSPERLNTYFTNEDDNQYRVKQMIREMLVFAPQNIINDAPFTKLDILSCRNLLIYLDAVLQKKLFPIFSYSLKLDGILFLGSSESIGQYTNLFSTLDRKQKIFRNQVSDNTPQPAIDFKISSTKLGQVELDMPDNINKAEEISVLKLVNTILQQSDTPPCAIIDDSSNVIYIHGKTGHFLEPAQGRISVNILEMARPGLAPGLAKAIRNVTLHKQEVILKDLQIEYDNSQLFLDVSIKPILEQSTMQGLMMVTFEEKTAPSKKAPTKTKTPRSRVKDKTVEELERELQFTREDLQTTIEELETSNEELRSTNEELQSTNEELQSTNEEMETSKEELQSLNEESTTVNAELQSRIDELSQVNDDMRNLLDSTNIATLFLDIDLCVRRFTPRTVDIIPLTDADTGRPIKHFQTSLIDADLSEYSAMVLNDLTVREYPVKSQDGKIYIMKLRPYRTSNNIIDGVVVTFEDTTDRVQH